MPTNISRFDFKSYTKQPTKVWIAAALLPAPAEEPPQTMNAMERVATSKVALAYVKPGTDWKKYKTI